jgi:hypothetical protein
MSFTILNSANVTYTIVATQLGNATTQIMQSIPTNTLGSAMLGSQTGANSLPVVICSDQTAFPITGGTTNINQVGGAAIALGQAAMASSFPVVFASNQSNITAVISNTVTAVVSGTVTVSGLAVTPATLTAVVSTSGAPAAIAVKSASGTLYGIDLFCSNTAVPTFLKIYNITAAGVNSSVVPFITIGVPPGAPNNWPINSNGFAMGGTGISYLITRNATANDTTAVNAYDLVGGLAYI